METKKTRKRNNERMNVRDYITTANTNRFPTTDIPTGVPTTEKTINISTNIIAVVI